MNRDDTAQEPSPYEGQLGVLASAVAGRRIGVRFDDVELAYIADDVVIVPHATDRNDVPIAVVAQSALAAQGSLHPTHIAPLRAKHSAIRRYMALELWRTVNEKTIPVPPRFREVFALASAFASQSPSESLELAVHHLDVPEPPERVGTIQPKALLKGAGARGLRAKLTERQLQSKRRDAEMDELDDDEDSSESKVMENFLSSALLENPVFRALRKQMGMGSREKSESGSDGDDMTIGSMKSSDSVSENAQLVTLPPGVDFRMEGGLAWGRHYPEWDATRRRYRPAYCTVGEYEPPLSPPDSALDPPNPRVRNRLARVGLTHERHRHLRDGDTLDPSALVEHAVALSLGHAEDSAVYEARRKTARDLSIFVLVDASGSTTQSSDSSPVWTMQRQLAADLIDGFDKVGDRVAAFGFNSRGRQNVRFLAIKEFDERFHGMERQRLLRIQPGGYTRLGAAVRHASHVIAKKGGTANKVVIVLSDGFPYDDDYEDVYAEKDTRRAIDEAHRKGIGCACISVGGTTSPEKLERLWGNTTHLQLDDPTSLPTHIDGLIESSLAAAMAVAVDERS